SGRTREPWRRVFGRPMGAATTVILIAFIAVAVLDSVHYKPAVTNDAGAVVRYGPQVISVFDALVTPLRMHDEKTYSAPFATHLYVKQMVPQGDGTTKFVYPPLQFGGADLQGRPERSDVLGKSLRGVLWGVLAALAVALAGLAIARLLTRRAFAVLWRQWLRGRTVVAWRSMWATLLLLAVVIGVLTGLSADYHVLGTDKIGQDVLFMTLKSIRTGVLIGTLTTLVMLPFA